MFIYLEAFEDAINLDHVLRIEFRNAQGAPPTRRGRAGGGWDIDPTEQAIVVYAFPGPLKDHPPLLDTYVGQAARELQEQMRGLASVATNRS